MHIINVRNMSFSSPQFLQFNLQQINYLSQTNYFAQKLNTNYEICL